MTPVDTLARVRNTRAMTDHLFGLVRPEAMFDRPIPERHRLAFYLGHLEAFDRNLLCQRPPRGELDKLFAFGIDPIDGRLPQDEPADWPTIDRIRQYARESREAVDETLSSGRPSATLRHVAIEHRLMHAETLCYALNQMPLRRLAPPRPRRPASTPVSGPASRPASRRRQPNRDAALRTPRAEIPAGIATLGRRRDAPGGFGWDNEYEEQPVMVPAFAIDRHNVTNGEYLRFVNAGGYEQRTFWSEEAWDWLRREGIAHPRLWSRAARGPLGNGGRAHRDEGRASGWRYRAMFSVMSLPLDWPVYVSWAEASAYARWAGRSLPTEPQWHRAAVGAPRGAERDYPWGDERPSSDHGNFGARGWDPLPVGSHPAGDSAFGVADLAGNGWEWTRTPFGPLPGFEAAPFYPGYSADFFPRSGPNGIHYVLKGGGPRTGAAMLRRSFRNWFQPLYPYVHATFRCVDE